MPLISPKSNASLNMDYDFKDYSSDDVRFAYKKQSEGTWTNTSWTSKSGSGSYSKLVEDLDDAETYVFKAQLQNMIVP